MFDTKYCPKCRLGKPLSAFHKNKAKSKGFSSWCKVCHLKYQRYQRATGKGKGVELKRKSKARGISFNMTFIEFEKWFDYQHKVCFYCGQPVFESVDLPQDERQLLALTIDRKDNDKPYALDNMAIACRRCNLMKGSWLTEKQMLDAGKRYFDA